MDSVSSTIRLWFFSNLKIFDLRDIVRWGLWPLSLWQKKCLCFFDSFIINQVRGRRPHRVAWPFSHSWQFTYSWSVAFLVNFYRLIHQHGLLPHVRYKSAQTGESKSQWESKWESKWKEISSIKLWTLNTSTTHFAGQYEIRPCSAQALNLEPWIRN